MRIDGRTDQAWARLGRIVVVTGTDTGVGKTHASAALAVACAAAGDRVLYLKPVQTGVAPAVEEPDIPDAETVARLVEAAEVTTGGVTTAEVTTAEGWRYGEPMAPVMAAAVEGAEMPSLGEIADWVRARAEETGGCDRVIVEGAGGLLVELCPGGDIPALVTSLRQRFGEREVSVVLVMRPGLGTLNHTGLSLRALRAEGIEPLLLLSGWPERPSLTERLNLAELRGMGDWLGEVPVV